MHECVQAQTNDPFIIMFAEQMAGLNLQTQQEHESAVTTAPAPTLCTVSNKRDISQSWEWAYHSCQGLSALLRHLIPCHPSHSACSPPPLPSNERAEQMKLHLPVTLLEQGLCTGQFLIQLLCSALCFTPGDVCIASQCLSLSAEIQPQPCVCAPRKEVFKFPVGWA